jgi:hypothetical protein
MGKNIDFFVQVGESELVEAIQNKIDINEAKEKPSRKISAYVIPLNEKVSENDIKSCLAENFTKYSVKVCYNRAPVCHPLIFCKYHVILERKKQN